MGYFRRESDSVDSSTTQHTKFQAQTYPGIAMGRSGDSNAMLFWSPETCRFSVSSHYKLDTEKQVRTHWPQLLNDGGFTLKVLSPQPSTEHSIGDTMYFSTPGPATSDGEAPHSSDMIISTPVPNVHSN